MARTRTPKSRRPTATPASCGQRLREHLKWLLDGGNAHLGFETAIAGLPAKLYGARVPNVPHTPWRLLEHMRIAQWDILEFCRNPEHVSPEWPQGYWPDSDAPSNQRAWQRSVAAFKADAAALRKLVANPKVDLLAPLPHCQGQTLLREALLAADHNAYHLGQLVLLRRALGAWKPE